jgi:lysophospholipase
MQDAPFDRRSIPAQARLSTWRAPDGWKHRRIDWRQPDGAAARGTLVFAGGRGDFIEKYLEAQNHWFRLGWNVVSFDWRGQGGSRGDVKGGHLDELDPLVDDLAALLAELREETPGPQVAIAHSMGGHVLMRLMAERRPPLAAAVLVAPMLMINSGPMPSFGAEWLASIASTFGLGQAPVWHPQPPDSLRQRHLTHCRKRYEDELWWWEKEPGFNLGAPSWGWLKAAYSSCARLTPEALASVETPILLVATEQDRLVSAEAIRRAAAEIPDCELLMFDRAAHEILREEDEVRLRALAAIDGFLDRHSGA